MAGTPETMKKIGKATRFKPGEKQAEIARKGAEASIKARQHNKTLRKAMEAVLSNTYTDKTGEKLTGAEVLVLNMFKIASSKDRNAVNAYRAVMETTGELDKNTGDMITDETRKAVAELIDGISSGSKKRSNKRDSNKDSE